jgi:TetR/AcrR family transcriptional regulator
MNALLCLGLCLGMDMTCWDRLNKQSADLQNRKRQMILLQALHLFARNGVSSTPLTEVAKSLGISKAALYRYVPSKDQLVCDCHAETVAIALEALSDAIETAGSGLQRLQLGLRGYLDELIALVGAPVLVVHASDVNADSFQVIRTQRDALEARLRILVELGISDGSISTMRSDLAVRSLLSALEAAARWCREDPNLNPGEISHALVDLATRALQAGADQGEHPTSQLVLNTPAETQPAETQPKVA